MAYNYFERLAEMSEEELVDLDYLTSLYPDPEAARVAIVMKTPLPRPHSENHHTLVYDETIMGTVS